MVACTAESATKLFYTSVFLFGVLCFQRKRNKNKKHCRFNCSLAAHIHTNMHSIDFTFMKKEKIDFSNWIWSSSFSFGFPHELTEAQSFNDYLILFICANVNQYARVCWHVTLFWLDARVETWVSNVCVFYFL